MTTMEGFGGKEDGAEGLWLAQFYWTLVNEESDLFIVSKSPLTLIRAEDEELTLAPAGSLGPFQACFPH